MPTATQKTPDQAAALIQARVRGLQHRQRQQRVVNAVTKLQARQRGRYTRREYQKLLEFYNEQESFLAESKRRQLRLWHGEQELYFLQHTTAEQLDAIREFQHERSARRIQREWRRLHPTPLEDVDISGLGRPFDPFGLASQPSSSKWTGLQPRAELLSELFGDVPTRLAQKPDTEKTARRRAEIQDRIKQKRKESDKRLPHEAKPTRRMLYDELVSLRQQTAQRLQEMKGQQMKRRQRDLEAAQLSASCRNRLAFLSDDSRVSDLLNAKQPSPERIVIERREFDEATSRWSDDRKRSAWENHSRILESVLGKGKWYETYIAGEKRDIRRVYARSPWESEKRMWQWPRSEEQQNSSRQPNVVADFRETTAMERFVFCLDDANENAPNNQEDDGESVCRPEPLDDKTASVWWRAHATQSHSNYRRLQERQLRQLRDKTAMGRSNNRSDEPQVTPEMLTNPLVYELYKRTNESARQKELVATVEGRMALLQQNIQRKVVEIETQIDINTRVIVEERNRVLQQKARKTKEEKSAIQIQRVARGKLGRNKAKDHLAQYFVMVRGRAIRKGKCEECGEQPAVLQCNECEEALHFCPVCWVQVHSTRRRKPHVPVPMAVVRKEECTGCE